MDALKAANDDFRSAQYDLISRQCSCCRERLPISSFRRCERSMRGFRRQCIICDRAKVAESRATKDRSAEYARRAEQLAARVDHDARAKKEAERRRRKAAKRWEAKRKAVKKALQREADIAAKPWLASGLTQSERQSLRRKLDPATILRDRTRCRMRRKGIKGDALKAMRQALKAKRPTAHRNGLESTLGYTIADLKRHLEEQFTGGMSWDVFHSGRIHIDHIRPLNLFNLMDPAEAEEAWALSNLRPLWAADNMRRPKDGSDIIVANDNTPPVQRLYQRSQHPTGATPPILSRYVVLKDGNRVVC